MNDMKERDFHDFYHESVGLLVWATVGVITISTYMVNRLKKKHLKYMKIIIQIYQNLNH